MLQLRGCAACAIAALAKGRLVRVFRACLGRSESTLLVPLGTMSANGRAEDNCRNAEHHLL
tara:strand:- start:705 stop:887 length:183 start_codon:yes stop_codon:yes gene_type:complete